MGAAIFSAVIKAGVAARATGPGGLVIDTELPVTAMDQRSAFAHNSPVIVAEPGSTGVMALASRVDHPEFGCSLHVSGDGGAGWLPSPVPALPKGAEKCYGPEIAYDANGRLKFLFVGLAGRGNSPIGAFLATSTDQGYSPARRVLGPERYMVRMAIDPTIGPNGRIHLVWLEAGADPPLGGLPQADNPIMAAYSDDDGKTFSRPVRISDPGRPRAVAPVLALGPDHSVHVAYYDLQDDFRDYQGLEGPVWEGNWSVLVSSSKDGGRSFGPGVVVDRGLVPPERVMLIFTMPGPALTTDPDGNVFVSWHDERNGDWDVFLSRSTTQGASWTPPRRLNDDAVANGRHQHLPRLSASSNGRLDAVFYDRRNDPANQKADIYLTSSRDAGKTFTANKKITTEPSDTMVGPRYPIPSALNLVEFGSRIGLLSSPQAVIPAWTDTRNSFSDSFQQEVYSTTVRLETKEPAGSFPWLPIGSAVVLLAAGSIFFLRKSRSPGARGEGASADKEPHVA